MKLYLVPVEKVCNGCCIVCITKFKKEASFGKFLEIDVLSKIKALKVDKIEITGGGEPFLHKNINDIIGICTKMAPTQIYTNGSMLHLFHPEIFRELLYLCISRLHYDPDKNRQLMGIEQGEVISLLVKNNIPIKLSLVLCKSGINCVSEIEKYLEWANSIGVRNVVVRQMFDYDPKQINENYLDSYKDEYVSSEKIFRQLNIGFQKETQQGNPLFRWKNIEVEFEFRSCACEVRYPILRADGNIYLGWTDTPWNSRG